jgi:hypothetical protein
MNPEPSSPKEIAMSTMTTSNGRVRKSLAEQIDRLDTILDTLGQGLNEAVATAVQDAVGVAVTEAVTAAVKAAVVEVLTNPDLLKRLRPQATPAPSLLSRVAHHARSLCGWLAGAAKAACSKVINLAEQVASRAVNVAKQAASKATQAAKGYAKAVCTRLVSTCRRAKALVGRIGTFLAVVADLGRQLRKRLLLALAVGVVVGVGCYLGGPVIASAVSGLAGFGGSLLVSALNALRRGLASLQLHHS